MGCSCDPSLVALPLWQGHEIGARRESSVCHSWGSARNRAVSGDRTSPASRVRHLSKHLSVPGIQVSGVQALDHVRSVHGGTSKPFVPPPPGNLPVVSRQQDLGDGPSLPQGRFGEDRVLQQAILVGPVSYTHLTLPT